MNSKQCSKCNEIKPESEFYKQTTKRNGRKYVGLQSYCKKCKGFKGVKGQYTPINYETLDDMISFAQSLGFKSASYAIDKYGKEQFKQMYYENIRTN